MNYTLTISAETLEELAEAIKGAAAQYQSNASAPIKNPTAPPANTAPQGPTLTQPPPAGPKAPVAPSPVPNPSVPLASAPTYTIDQISKAGAELVQAGKMNELLALLQQYGIQAVTQLNSEQIGPFATALRGLGANL